VRPLKAQMPTAACAKAGYRILLKALASMIMAGATWSAPALAQQQPQASAAEPDHTGIIRVTARRRAERLIDVPVAATTLRGEALGRFATTDLSSVATKVPQLKIDRVCFVNGVIINIRGVGSSAVNAALEQEVTVNIDGVPISRGRVVTQALFDFQSIEVPKGPKALFLSKNSPAGVIFVNTTNAGHDLASYIALAARGGERDGKFHKTLDTHPMGRIASSDEVANALLFPASAEESSNTGASLKVDRGQML
jgi:outer membrane receptor protein involved in Fe transport